MPRPIAEVELSRIEEILRKDLASLPARRIANRLEVALPIQTMQYRLRRLVDSGRVVMHGKWRGSSTHSPQGCDRGTGPGSPRLGVRSTETVQE